MTITPKKNLKLYYSIGEVSEMLSIPVTRLRFYEQSFPAFIKPRRAGRGIRQYTQEDIDRIRLICDMTGTRGFKIEGARRMLRKNKDGTLKLAEAINCLQQMREDLMAIKRNLDGMV